MEIKGNVYEKVIKGKTYYSHQYREDGKMVVSNLDKANAYELAFQICHDKNGGYEELTTHIFNTDVAFGASLLPLTESVSTYKERYSRKEIDEYLDNPYMNGRVLVLYGLRRSGKSTMILQTILGMPLKKFVKAAFIRIAKGDTTRGLETDLDFLFKQGFEYIFVDEVTLLEDFIETSSVYADIYASMGKIVLSGTDSLGFMLASHNELYDRAKFIHTSYIPYYEWSDVLGKKGIDEYIEYGGSMSLSGLDYNKVITGKDNEVNEYVDTAIAHNIVHSLNNYKDGSRFSLLYELNQKGEAINAINRMVEDVNRRFVIETIEKDFKSHDYGSLKQLISKDKDELVRASLDEVNEDAINNALMEALKIINKPDQTYPISEALMKELEEYLDLLDVTKPMQIVRYPSYVTSIKKAFLPLGLRYSQAKALLETIMSQPSILALPVKVQQAVKDKLLSDVKGRMMEEIVLCQTSLAKKEGDCFQLLFTKGEYDMVTLDRDDWTAEIYEIKYNEHPYPGQARFLIDPELASIFEGHYAKIDKRVVIYRGPNQNENGIEYINVHDYLAGLN